MEILAYSIAKRARETGIYFAMKVVSLELLYCTVFINKLSLWKHFFQFLHSKNIYYTSLKLTPFFKKRVVTLPGNGRDKMFVTNMSSVRYSLPISIFLHVVFYYAENTWLSRQSCTTVGQDKLRHTLGMSIKRTLTCACVKSKEKILPQGKKKVYRKRIYLADAYT